jgi:hypothetical protein
MMRFVAIALMLGVLGTPCIAAVYKCADATGKIVYSDKPCYADSNVMSLPNYVPESGSAAGDSRCAKIRQDMGALTKSGRLDVNQDLQLKLLRRKHESVCGGNGKSNQDTSCKQWKAEMARINSTPTVTFENLGRFKMLKQNYDSMCR